jgi:hypothetical protein
MNLIYDYTFFCLDFMLRECRAGGKLKKKGCCLAQVFFKHGGVKYDLLLGGKGIEFASEALKITVYDRCASLGRTLEQGMLGEVGYSFVVTRFVSCAAMYAEGAISDSRTAALDGIRQSAICLSAYHPVTLSLNVLC